jgi:hypothetical protein
VAGPTGATGAAGSAGNTLTFTSCTLGTNCSTGPPSNTFLVGFVTGTNLVQSAFTSPKTGVIGVATADAASGGPVTVQLSGPVSCTFENTATAGDYVQAANSHDGECLDVGSTYPTSNQIIGVALSTGAGSQSIYLLGAEVDAIAGGGGAAGPTGPTGPAGLAGATGAAGPTGLDGVAGATGARGATGSLGAAGPTGSAGSNGPAGPTGATGPTGTVAAGGVAQMLLNDFASVSVAPPSTYSVPVNGGALAIASTTVSEVYEEQVVSSPGTISDLHVRVASGGVAYQVTVTLWKNGSNTGLTCQTGTTAASLGATTTCSDPTHTVSVAEGDSLAYVVLANVSNNSCRVSTAVHFQ